MRESVFAQIDSLTRRPSIDGRHPDGEGRMPPWISALPGFAIWPAQLLDGGLAIAIPLTGAFVFL